MPSCGGERSRAFATPALKSTWWASTGSSMLAVAIFSVTLLTETRASAVTSWSLRVALRFKLLSFLQQDGHTLPGGERCVELSCIVSPTRRAASRPEGRGRPYSDTR